MCAPDRRCWQLRPARDEHPCGAAAGGDRTRDIADPCPSVSRVDLRQWDVNIADMSMPQTMGAIWFSILTSGPNADRLQLRNQTVHFKGPLMPDVQVRCINKQPRNDPHEGITHLGGDQWKWTRQQVITSIEAKTNTFFTYVGGKRADVGVVNGQNGKYVRTYADGKWNDNLLALPECL